MVIVLTIEGVALVLSPVYVDGVTDDALVREKVQLGECNSARATRLVQLIRFSSRNGRNVRLGFVNKVEAGQRRRLAVVVERFGSGGGWGVVERRRGKVIRKVSRMG